MDNSFTVNASLIAAIAAICAPAITTLIHSIKEYMITKRQIIFEKARSHGRFLGFILQMR